MDKNWHGIMKVIEFSHFRNNEIIFQQNNILNTLHALGEEYVMKVLFTAFSIPANYFIGLDNRVTVALADTIDGLTGEPTSNGYFRQSVSSSTGFVLEQVGIAWQASSAVVTFQATGSGWGPVKNIFLATTSDNTGTLIATAFLDTPISLSAGDSILMRMGCSLQNL